MANFIHLHDVDDNTDILLNVEHISSVTVGYADDEKVKGSCVCHRKRKFFVKETPQEIIELIIFAQIQD